MENTQEGTSKQEGTSNTITKYNKQTKVFYTVKTDNEPVLEQYARASRLNDSHQPNLNPNKGFFIEE